VYVGQNFVWVGQARVWVGHGLPGLIARTASVKDPVIYPPKGSMASWEMETRTSLHPSKEYDIISPYFLLPLIPKLTNIMRQTKTFDVLLAAIPTHLLQEYYPLSNFTKHLRKGSRRWNRWREGTEGERPLKQAIHLKVITC